MIYGRILYGWLIKMLWFFSILSLIDMLIYKLFVGKFLFCFDFVYWVGTIESWPCFVCLLLWILLIIGPFNKLPADAESINVETGWVSDICWGWGGTGTVDKQHRGSYKLSSSFSCIGSTNEVYLKA